MNVRIFWAHAMKCMCAQTRPRFILSSEGVLGGNGVGTHVNSKGKIPSTGKCPQRRIEPVTLWTVSPSTTNWAIAAPYEDLYNLLTAPRTVQAQVARVQSCANHAQDHYQAFITCNMSYATRYKGTAQLLQVCQSWITFILTLFYWLKPSTNERG